MPWFAWLYLVFLGALTGAAAFDDLRDHEKLWRIVVDVAAGALELAFVVAWYRGVPPLLANPIFPALFFFAVLWFAQQGVHVARHYPFEKDDPGERLEFFTVASIAVVVSVLPAFIAGGILSYRILVR